MQQILINVDDSIAPKIISFLKSFPKDKLEIVGDMLTPEELDAFKTDLRKAFAEINEIEKGKKAKSWWEIRDEL